MQSVKQFDASLGGPISKAKVWFFATFRHADLANGISRTPANVANLAAFKPGFHTFDNFMKSSQPFVKVTATLSSKHQMSAFYQRDRARYTSDRELNTTRSPTTRRAAGCCRES